MLVVLNLGLCACASVTDRTDPVQYLDRDTAAHFVVAAQPLIFAHARPQTAARVRDYATVAAASMDRAGRIEYVLLIYRWSTVDPRDEPGNGPGVSAPPADLTLVADDRRIKLHPIADRTQSVPPLDRPPTGHFGAAIYRTDLPTLLYLTKARYLSLVRGEGRAEVRFALWQDPRACLAALVRSLR